MKKMRKRVGVYAGSVRPGGGLTIVQHLVKALVANGHEVIVYTGASDCSTGFSKTILQYKDVSEVKFYPRLGSLFRYLLSKVYFFWESRKRKLDGLISVNYYIPVQCQLIVYHINLLSFVVFPGRPLSDLIKRFDARIACKFSNVNIFESKFLEEMARKVSSRVNNSELLYMGVDEDFYQKKSGYDNNLEDAVINIMIVSSVQEHKRNTISLLVIKKLYELRPDVKWHFSVAGGQSVEQWKEFVDLASDLGVEHHLTIFGPKSKFDLSGYLNKSLCLLSTSVLESFCMVALEAMASQCPCIVTNESSMPESVGNNAIIVNAGDVDSIALAMIKLYESEKYRTDLVERGFTWAKKFNFNRLAERLDDIVVR